VLTDTEKKCMQNCSEKFLKLTQRVGFRFAEHQAERQQEMKGSK
jgi:import inner membrane translocase subunit TIM9